MTAVYICLVLLALIAVMHSEVLARRRARRSRRLIRQLEGRVSELEADLNHAEAERDSISEELDEAYQDAADLTVERRELIGDVSQLRRALFETRTILGNGDVWALESTVDLAKQLVAERDRLRTARQAAWDRTDAETLIAMIRDDLADTTDDAGAPPEWCAGWSKALHEYGEPAIEALQGAMAEIDRLAVEVRAVTSDREAIAAQLDEIMMWTGAGPLETPALAAKRITAERDQVNERIADACAAVAARCAREMERQANRPPSCPALDAFFDGELLAAAATFRDHLATCERCQQTLDGRMREQVAVSTRAPEPAP